MSESFILGMAIRIPFIAKSFLPWWLATMILGNLEGQNIPDSTNLREQINQIIRYDTEIPLESHHGFIVGIIDGERQWILSFPGIGKDSLNAESVFELGGLSQAITAHYLIDLVHAGRLELDEPLAQGGLKLPGDWKKLTWQQCIQNATGLPKVLPGLSVDQLPDNPYGQITIPELVEVLTRMPFHPGTFSYSPHGYALIQAALEFRLGKQFERQINDFCDSLGLSSTGVFRKHASGLLPGYRRNNLTAIAWNAPAYQAALGLTGTINDLLHYARWLITNAKNPEYSLLFQPSLRTHLRGRIWMAGGWYVLNPVGRREIYTHSGQTGGHKSYLGFVPATKTAVIVLGQSPEETNELGLLILRMINDSWKRKEP